jgi:hypothetical protein
MRIADRSLENVDRINNEQAELVEQTEGERFGNDQFRTRQGSLDRAPGQYAAAKDDAAQHSGGLLEMMRRVLMGDLTALQTAPLQPAQQRAMEMLQAAVVGRDPVAHVKVFAEDRRMMLEQSIAALQPLLGMGGMHLHDEVNESQSMFAKVLFDINELREKLERLESTQDEAEVFADAKKLPQDDADETDESDDDSSSEPSSLDEDDETDVGESIDDAVAIQATKPPKESA